MKAPTVTAKAPSATAKAATVTAKAPNTSANGQNGGPNGSPASGLHDQFRDIADRITRAVGSPMALIAAIALILLWAVSGPIFGFSDSWQLVINTTTTIITFLMVFVIQTSQNRDGRAIQIKLDELIRSHSEARNELMATEKGPEAALTALEEEFEVEAADQPRRPLRRPATTRSSPSSAARSGNRSANRSSKRSANRSGRS